MIEKFSIERPKFHRRSRTHREKCRKEEQQVTETNNRFKGGDFRCDYLMHIMPKIWSPRIYLFYWLTGSAWIVNRLMIPLNS